MDDWFLVLYYPLLQGLRSTPSYNSLKQRIKNTIMVSVSPHPFLNSVQLSEFGSLLVANIVQKK
jgi:hypothetical protein